MRGYAARMNAVSLASHLTRRAAELDETLRPEIIQTPLVPWRTGEGRRTIEAKLENLQVTGSFKARGAFARVRQAKHAGADRVVTSSTGNHGRAVAHAAAGEGLEAVVFVPQSAAASKVAAIEALGAVIVPHDGDPVLAEVAARAHAAHLGVPYLSPYNDPEVIAGQATVGRELLRQSRPVDELYVAVGGGGLIGGIAAVVRRAWPECTIIGASPEHSPAMARSVAAGRVVDVEMRPTLSDGTAGGVEPGAITLDLCASLVDRWIEVPERVLAPTIAGFAAAEGHVVEGAAAVALWAAAEHARTSAIVIVCGGNLDEGAARRVLG